MVSATVVYDGPFYLEEIRLISPDPDPCDWLEGIGDEEVVCINWTNCTMYMKAATARSWLQQAIAA